MKYEGIVVAVVLAGTLAIGSGWAFAQDSSESNQPGENPAGATEPGGPSPGQSGKDQGDSGLNLSSDEIKQIQNALKEKGHNPGSATGVMNEETREAIREFQKANNLSVTGTLDQETAQMLGVSVSGSAGTGKKGASPRSKSGSSSPGSGGTENSGSGSGSTGSESAE
jgi:peptidoglycan hydrolase-like protein with peptidoglycan-binding domain